jgi:hypothetical protein
MALQRQKRKQFLTVKRPIVTAGRPNLTFRIETIQLLKAFPFLILKTHAFFTPPPRNAIERRRRRGRHPADKNPAPR